MRALIPILAFLQLYILSTRASPNPRAKQENAIIDLIPTIPKPTTTTISSSKTLVPRKRYLPMPFDGVRLSNSLNIRVPDVISHSIIFAFGTNQGSLDNYLIAARFLMTPDGVPYSWDPIRDLKNQCETVVVLYIAVVVPAAFADFGRDLVRELRAAFRLHRTPDLAFYGPQPDDLPEGAHVVWTFEMGFESQELMVEESLVNLRYLDFFNEPTAVPYHGQTSVQSSGSDIEPMD